MADDRSDSAPSGGTATAQKPPDTGGLLRSLAHRLAGDPAELPDEGRLPGFGGATGWLNSDPLTPDGLRGRVVLVDFWTYTCINWLRTLPYLRAWDAKYRDKGLTIIGAHTPEFRFERTVENIVARSADFGVVYPVAIDSDYGVWQAFSNHFWPAVYLADAEGRIRYHHFGEGEYQMTEMVIQQLLVGAGAEDLDVDLVSVEPTGFEVAADWSTLRTPETYVSFGRSAGFASPDEARYDEPHAYPVPGRIGLNQWAPSGTWRLGPDVATLVEAPGRIAFGFQARDVNLVMSPARPGTPIRYRVLLDGNAPGDAGGFDVDADGNGVLADQRLYQLIRQSDSVDRPHLVEIEFLEPGAAAYCFTFG